MFGGIDKSRLWFLLLAGALIAVLVACGPAAAPTSQPTATPAPTSTPAPSPTPVPSPTPPATPAFTGTPTVPPVSMPGVSVVVVQAPVEQVTIEAPENLSRFVMVVVSGLRNSCESFNAARVSRSGDTLTLTVTNQKKVGSDVACAMVYGTVTNTIPLSGEFEVCETYTVVVNGQPRRVQATAPNADCAPPEEPTGTPDPGVGGEGHIQIKVGETVPVGDEGLSVTFLRVSEDSRCPKDVTCVWAGRATVVINFKLGDRDLGEVSLTLEPDRGDLPSAKVDGYSVVLTRLDPYPESPEQIDPDEYVAFLVVSRS